MFSTSMRPNLVFITFHNRIFVVLVFDKILRHPGHYRERAGGIFSKITFLKSVDSTDQNAL